MIRLFVNPYRHADPLRDAELQDALGRNRGNAMLAVHAIEGRPTVGEMFHFAHHDTETDDICIITNADIVFDETLEMANEITRGECFALSRWEEAADGTISLFDHAHVGDSQDCWIFRGPPPEIAADFGFGVGGCDNKLAYLLIGAGMTLSNPSMSIHAIHLHKSGVRNWRERERLKPPFALVRACNMEGAFSV